jgi:GTP-binding protein
MYNVKSAEFTRGIVGTNEILLGEKPQVAFVGRSNVGKSTLINSLVGKKDLARSSSNPGRTQEINFFLVNENIYFVDLPGYGFAKISKKRREKMRKMIVWYLSYADSKPKKVILVIDSKAGIKEFDRDMINLLKEEKIDFVIVVNKIDKIKKSLVKKVIESIKNEIGDDNIDLIEFSSKTLQNKNKVLSEIFD